MSHRHTTFAFLVALSITLAACSGSGTSPLLTSPSTTSPPSSAPTSTTTSTTTTTTTTTLPPVTSTAPTPAAFPREVVDAYVAGCSEEDTAAYCQCTIAEFEERLSIDDFLDLTATADLESHPLVVAVHFECADLSSGGQVTSASLGDVVDRTINDLVDYWTVVLPDVYGIAYEDLAGIVPVIPSSGNVPSCGGEVLSAEAYSGNAFYCRPDDYVAWDAEQLFPDLLSEFGDFAVSLVLAHEWGHAIQQRGRVQGPTILTELQADCFAGAWAGDVDAGGSPTLTLAAGDLEEGMAGYLIFRDPPGTLPSDPGAHGSAFDRVTAFQDGFFNGASTCQRYEDGEFSVIDIPLTLEDLETGGNLPFDQTAPLVTTALETYWSIVYPELFGSEYIAMTAFGPYFPSTGALPACGEALLDESFYSGNAFYCPDADYVAWDEESLTPGLYVNIGDFAVGLILAQRWAEGVQARAGIAPGAAAELQADCFAGSWAFALTLPEDQNPMEIRLSAGDLDEAIAGFLLFGDREATSGTPFERFDAFKLGFLAGPVTCLDFTS